MQWRGAYSGVTTYIVDDVVYQGTSAWICTASTSGNAPPTLPTLSNAYWAILAQGVSNAAGISFTPTGGIASTDVQNALAELDTEKAVKANPVFTGSATFDTDALVVDGANNRVGVGVTVPAYPLHVSGDIYSTGNVTAYSDKRVKTDIELISGAVAKVMSLNGYTYTRIDTGERQTGLIAQEVLAVMPEAVVGSEEEHYAVAYGNLVGLLVEAVKDLQRQIYELQK
jgi:hypothetical protein